MNPTTDVSFKFLMPFLRRMSLLVIFGLLSFAGRSQNLTAQFLANDTEICLGDPILFSDLSTAGNSPIQIWNWDFGDGFSSQSQNPSHTYTAPGTYNVTLTVQAMNGTSDVEIKSGYIIVHPLPVVGFSLSNQPCSVPFNAQFSNTSSTGNYSYSWSFGNGQSSTSFNPTGISYASAGTYPVTLTVVNLTTGCVNTLAQNIQVQSFSAGFSAPSEACVNEGIAFTNTSSPSATSWLWDFGNGITSASENPTYPYSTPGTYTVTLTATDAVTGCTAVTTQTIVVHPLPVADFTVDEVLGCNPLTVTFTNTSTGGSNYTWFFGDGTSYVGMTPPPHVYSVSDTFDVTLIVTSANGCQDIQFNSDFIIVDDLEAGFIIDPKGGCEPLDVQFTDTTHVVNSNDPIVSWNWDFGNGNTFSGPNPPGQTYLLGTYDVGLTVTTASGCVSDVVYFDSVTVGIIDSVAFSNFPLVICAKESVGFTNETVITAPYLPGEVTYSWTFGDGGFSNVENPGYNYPSDTGYFDVQLVVNFRGCLDSVMHPNAVYVNAPVSNFFPLTSVVCNPASLPVNVGMSDMAILGQLNDDVDMIWNWGDGTSTYLDDPELDDANQGDTLHSFGAYGTYYVQQIVHNYTTGCTDSSLQAVNITFMDTQFGYSSDTVCLGTPVILYDQSVTSHTVSLDTNTNYYNLDNGIFELGAVQNYLYLTPGSYDIVHYAQNNFGCADSDTLFNFTVLSPPTSAIDPSSASGCAPLNLTFNNNSAIVGNGAPFASFDWTLPNGVNFNTTNVNQSLDYTFNQEGTFFISIQATDAFGCMSPVDSAQIDITKPNASFLLDSVVCNQENFTATNQSSGDQPISYEWFIDGNPTSTNPNLNSQLNGTGSSTNFSQSHDVMLIVTDANGCEDTLNQALVVSLPYANANASFTSASVNEFGEFNCPPVFASLTDTSQAYGSLTNWNWTFGNGNASTLQNPQNTYVFAGTYTATLTVTDEFGCVDDTVLTDYVVINGPTGNPGWLSVGDLCDPSFEFYVEDQLGVTSVEWNLGNGTTINDTSAFVYAYDTTGVYVPIAIISDDNGCAVPYQLAPITVNLNILDAYFTASMLEGEVSELFEFDDGSTFSASPIVGWEWDFGESVQFNNTDANVINDWNYAGTQNVILTVYDANGCSDSYSLQVLISANFNIPNVFTPNNDGINDFFMLDFDVFKSYDYAVVNRWGNVIVEAEGNSGVILWDGNNRDGTPCSEGVYFYTLRGYLYGGEEIVKHGFVTLAR